MEPEVVQHQHGRRKLVFGWAIGLLVALLALTAIWQLRSPAATVQALGDGADPAPSRVGPALATPAPAALNGATMNNDILQLVVGGVPQRFSSGDTIPIAGDVVAKVVVTGSDPTPYYRNVDVYVYHEGNDRPIDGADVQARVHMLYMDHGTAQPGVVRGDSGHYIAPIQFAMVGEWELDVTIATADTQGTFALTFGVDH